MKILIYNSEKLEKFLSDHCVNRKKLCKVLNLSNGKLYRYLKSEPVEPMGSFILALSLMYRVSPMSFYDEVEHVVEGDSPETLHW